MLTKELLTTQINYIEKRSCYHGERERERERDQLKEWNGFLCLSIIKLAKIVK